MSSKKKTVDDAPIFLVQINVQGSPHALQLMSQQIRVESPV